MIRFVNLGNQIEEDISQFTFFDTITGQFVHFGGEQVFDSVMDFKQAFSDFGYGGIPIERFLDLIPYGHLTQTS